MDSSHALRIGVISDTHSLLRLEALTALQGSGLIIHAGDVGKPEILEQLREIAPVVAIRGNIDRAEWARKLPSTEIVQVGQTLIYVIHNLDEMDLDPKAAGFSVVVYGHSHKAKIESKDGVLYLNPGSAGPRRFSLPVSVAELRLEGGLMGAKIVELEA